LIAGIWLTNIEEQIEMYDFSADDIFEMAEQMEKNGAAFYRQAAASLEEASFGQMLQELAAMEDEHEQTFAAMRSGLSAVEKESTVFDPSDESALYLKSLVDTKVFFKKEIDLSSMREILKAAIEAEKDSIVFYLGMQKAVPAGRGKGRLEAIINEEMSHIRLLSTKLAAL
jgi:rubrerythrin